jgi:uncharacterized membrane protein YesL
MTTGTARGVARARPTSWRDGLGDFADCLLVGLLVALAALPVLTAAPAFAAGCRVADRTRRGVSRPLWTSFWADFRQAARGGVAFTAITVLVAALFALDLQVVGASVPGAGVVQPVLGVLAALVTVVAVRTCEVVAVHRQDWRHAVRTAARVTVSAPESSVLLAAAVAVAGLLVWMQPLLACLVGGPLALAAVATGGRG